MMATRALGPVVRAEAAPATTAARRLALRRPRLSTGGAIGLAILLAIAIASLAGPALLDADPRRQALGDRFTPPFTFGAGETHLLGADHLGRDILARLLVGARWSLALGVVATGIAGVAGVALGLVAGYLGGRTDAAITLLADAQLALPFVVVAVGVVALFGNSAANVIAVLAITGWVGFARIVRLQTASLSRAPYVEAARALGATRRRVLAAHILPNVAGPVIVVASQQIAAMVLYESALSFLGLGAPAGTISWGGMVADGRESLMAHWWVTAIPGLAIAVTILALNLTGDWLQRVFTTR